MANSKVLASVADAPVGIAEGNGYGRADTEKKKEAKPGTIDHLASVSKSMTATGLMVLAERGLIDLDVPATNYALNKSGGLI